MVNNSIEDIRAEFLYLHKNKIYNSAGLLEIKGASFIANKDSIFGKPNKEYINKEIMWYNSKSRNINDMHQPPKMWEMVASKDGKVNSNYGWCIYSEENHRQYYNVLRTLRQNPNSRQATMIYTRPSMHEDSKSNGMNDFICTNAVTYSISGLNSSVLDCVVQMRSNDAVYGYKNDYAWQDYVLSKLSKDLGIQKGIITWQAASLHIYPRHFKLLDDFI